MLLKGIANSKRCKRFSTAFDFPTYKSKTYKLNARSEFQHTTHIYIASEISTTWNCCCGTVGTKLASILLRLHLTMRYARVLERKQSRWRIHYFSLHSAACSSLHFHRKFKYSAYLSLPLQHAVPCVCWPSASLSRCHHHRPVRWTNVFQWK